MENSNELTPEEKLRIENELLRSKLTAEFGMSKMESSLPEDEENEWLKYLYSFEKSMAEYKPIKIYDLIDRPEYKPLDMLREEEIESELDRLMDILEENSIVLDLLCAYEDKVIYKFVTEELFQEETNENRIEGMTSHYIYEEFHPNHEYDIKNDIESLFDSILTSDRDHRFYEHMISNTVEFENKEMGRREFSNEIDHFKEEINPGGVELLEFYDVTFDLDKRCGNAKGELTFSVKDCKSSPAHISGEFSVDVRFNEFEFWEIKKIVLPEI